MTQASGRPNKRNGSPKAAGQLVVRGQPAPLPPILSGRDTPAVRKSVQQFYGAVADIFERWVTRRDSHHTQRNYRGDIMAFVKYLGVRWPDDAEELFTVSVADVHDWRDTTVAAEYAPKTINRRISSLSSFYKYLGAVAAEMRLPITVPNPAHAQFIARSSTDPVQETQALSATRARQLMGLPSGDDLIARRDRAILKFYLYSGARLATGCRLKVADFRNDHEHATIRINEKGNKRRTIGLHFAAAEALSEYIDAAEIAGGPIFRPRLGPTSRRLANKPISPTSMYELIQSYLGRLPGATKSDDGTTYCVYSPHSLRATTATLLLDAGVDIRKVQELLGHKHVTTTQGYDKKRRRTVKESASHDVPI